MKLASGAFLSCAWSYYVDSSWHAFAAGGGRDSPRRATSFLVRDKKGGKETRPTVCGPCGANLRRGACGVRRITHYAAAQLRSDKCGESVYEAGVSFGTPATPQAPRRRRSQKGGTGRAIAALGPGFAGASATRWQARPSAAMARRDVGLPALLYAPAARRGWRIRARDCLSAAGASSSETPPASSTAGCPQRSEGTQTAGSPFFWVLFFGEAKNKYLARRGETRPPPSKKPQRKLLKK
jgi:hypothetical protein